MPSATATLPDSMLEYYTAQVGRVGTLIGLEREFFLTQMGESASSVKTWGDAALQYYATMNGRTAANRRSLNDEAREFYASLSGLPASSSVYDHMKQVFGINGGGPSSGAPITDQLEAMFLADYPDGYLADSRVSKNLLGFNHATAEIDAVGWGAFQGTVSRVTSQFYSGTASIQSVATVANLVNVTSATSIYRVPVTAGASYAAHARVRCTTSATVTAAVGIFWYDAAGAQITFSQAALTALAVGTWEKRTHSGAVAPANAVTAEVYVAYRGTFAIGETFHNDEHGLWLGSSTDWIMPGKLHNINILTLDSATFEYGTVGQWVAGTNATGLANNGTTAAEGSRSVQFQSAAAGNFRFRTATGTSGIPVTVGKVYTFTAETKCATTARNSQLSIDWYSSAGSYMSTSSGLSVAGSTVAFVRNSVTGIAPTGAAYAVPLVDIVGAVAGGEVVYADKIGFWEGGQLQWVPPYRGKNVTVDGSTVGFWRDLSGKERHLTQGTSTSRPLFRKPTANAVTKNLLTYNQATAETDTTGIANSSNCNVTRTTTQFLSGVASISMSSIAGGNMACQWGVSGSIRAPVTAGQSYTAVAAIKAAANARVVSVDILWFTALLSGFISTSAGSLTTSDNTSNWTTIVTTATAPANATYATVIVNVISTGGAAEVHYVDQVGLWATQSYNNGEWEAPGYPFYNLLTYNQATVETDATGLTSNGNCTVARSTAQASHGTGSLSLTSSAAGDMSAITSTGLVAVTPSAIYTGVASIRSAVSVRSCRVELRWFDAAQALITTTLGTAANDATGAWTIYSVTGAAPSNAAYAALIVRVLSTGAAAEVHYADNMGITRGENTVWKPTLTSPGSKPNIQFGSPATACFLEMQATGITGAKTIYMVRVAQATIASQDPTLITGEVGIASAGKYAANHLGTYGYAGTTFSDPAGAPAVGDIVISSFKWNISGSATSNTKEIYGSNSVISSDGNAGANDWGTNKLNVGGRSGQASLRGCISALLIYSTVHTDAQRQQIERWLGGLYGVTVA